MLRETKNYGVPGNNAASKKVREEMVLKSRSSAMSVTRKLMEELVLQKTH